MSRESQLSELFKVITEPEKQEFILGLDDSVLSLMLRTQLGETEWTTLRAHEPAYLMRTLYRHRAVDYYSKSGRQLEQLKATFINHPKYIPYEKLLYSREITQDANHKLASQHPHQLSELTSNYGVEVVGAIPNDGKVTLLVAHDQLIHTHDTYFPTPLSSETYHIPKLLKSGELFVNGMSNAIETQTRDGDSQTINFLAQTLFQPSSGEIFFSMASLEYGQNIWDVVFE